jgi:predicted outer membrane lipoprotein
MAYNSFAQPGLDEMRQARQDLTSSFFSSVDASLVLAAIFGIIGALKIYHNWQMGKERITADVSAWFFASLFMVLMGAFVRAIFGI